MPKDPHAKKRKKKLAEKKRQARFSTGSLAYTGGKYKTDELAPVWLPAEVAIYQTYILTDRTITDQTVVSALVRLIRQMRTASLPPLPESDHVRYEIGLEEDLLIDEIRRNWERHFAKTEWRPPRDDLIGILRSILGTIEKVRAPGRRSQSYLRYIETFLVKKLGISVKVSEEESPLPEPAEDKLARRHRAGPGGALIDG